MKPTANEESWRRTCPTAFVLPYQAVDGAQNFSRTIHYKLRLALNLLPGRLSSRPHPQEAHRVGLLLSWNID